MKTLLNLIKGIILIPILFLRMFLAIPFMLLAFLVAIGEGDIYKASENIFGKITDMMYRIR